MLIVLCIAVCGIFAVKLYYDGKEISSENNKNSLEEVEVEYTSDGNGTNTYVSDNGYSVKYPDKYTAKKIAKAIDFILVDEKSGSSINIVTAKNDGSLKKMTKEEFEESLKSTGMNVLIESYEDININGIPAVMAKYKYSGNDVTQTIIILDAIGYNITMTMCNGISDEILNDFEEILQSFKLR